MARARYIGLCVLASLCLAQGAHPGHDEEEPVNLVAPDQIRRLLDIGGKIAFIDLREAPAFAKGHLPGANSIPVSELARRWAEIPRSGRVVLYCPCPRETKDETYAYLLLRKERYRNISVLEGGYTEWTKRGYPIRAGSP